MLSIICVCSDILDSNIDDDDDNVDNDDDDVDWSTLHYWLAQVKASCPFHQSLIVLLPCLPCEKLMHD